MHLDHKYWLNAIISFLSARCIRWSIFVLIRVFCRCVIGVMLLHCVCAIIIVCSTSFHLLLSQFDISVLRLQLIHQSLKYQGVERPKLQSVSYWPRLVCGTTFLPPCLPPERWMGLREQSIVGCFPELYFPVFRGAGACGVAKVIYKQFGFSHLGLCCWF